MSAALGERKKPSCGKGDELQVEIRFHLFSADVQQSLDRKQAVVADVDMAAHREKALGDREIAIAKRPLDYGLLGQRRLEFAPERDAFEQGAGKIEPRQSQRQRGVEMEVRIDEGRADEAPARLQHLSGFGDDLWLQGRDTAVLHRDILARSPVGQCGVSNEKIECHREASGSGDEP